MNKTIENINNIWNEALTLIAPKMSVTFFDVWVKNLTPVQLTDEKFYLLANLESTKNVINNKYLDIITDCVKTVHPFISKVIVFCENDDALAAEPLPPVDHSEIERAPAAPINDNMFDEFYTFDNFVVGSSNEIAFAAAKAVAENPGKLHNPLFVYGGVGLGKTHIIHAIGNYILEHNPKTNILYVTTEKFTCDYMASFNNSKDSVDKSREFREKYRNVDVLMLDDIQFISGKTGTQEALFHTFNDLYQSKRQIIFTSDCHPRDLNNLEDRLKSRFQYGLTVDISYPNIETRIAILRSKAYKKKFQISDAAIGYIADKMDTNIRELEGALSKVMFYCSLNGLKADNIDVVALALKDELDTASGPVTIDFIVNQVCSYFAIDHKDIVGKKRTKQLAEARQIAIYIINEHLSIPLSMIGDYFSRDHSTVSHARDKISELFASNPTYTRYINDINDLIKNKD